MQRCDMWHEQGFPSGGNELEHHGMLQLMIPYDVGQVMSGRSVSYISQGIYVFEQQTIWAEGYVASSLQQMSGEYQETTESIKNVTLLTENKHL